MRTELAAFILTNGRPDRVRTYSTLRRCGFTGPIRLIVDDLDKTVDKYREKYGDEVIVFDKRKIAQTFDQGDNFDDMRAIVYARNASFEIAKKLGFRYFIQLDDDYQEFQFRFNRKKVYGYALIKNLDKIFDLLLRFFIRSGASSVALAQGGDFIGGDNSDSAENIHLKRKCMNSFICSTDRPFQFIGRINEDVNTYTRQASTGLLMFTVNQVALVQIPTQSNPGGMSEHYLDVGTYVKSFYTVMYQPSSVRVKVLRDRNSRLHHQVRWRYTVPKILSEDVRKK